MRARFLWLGSLMVLLALQASRASAQQWLSDRSRMEGRGIRVGPLVLHPGIGTEVGWDSNVFLAEHDPVDNTEQSAILRVSPHFDVSTPAEARKLTFRGGVNASLRHYFATSAGTTVNLGERLNLKWQPTAVFAWELFQDLTRTAVPFTDPDLVANADSAAFNFGRNQIGVGTRLQLSTATQTLKAGLGYRLDLDVFDADVYDANDSKAHTFSADTSWEFLPKTAFVWNSNVKLRGYDDPDASAVGERNDSTETNSRFGLNGALTSRVGFTLAVGYGAGFFEDDGDYENLLAQVEARYKLSEASGLSIGYDRTTTPSYFGNSMDSDRIKAALQGIFGGVFALGLKAEFAFIAFGVDDSLGATDRTDKQLLTSLGGEYRFTHWFALTGELGYSQNFTTYAFPGTMTATGMAPDDPAKWRRFEAWFGVRAFL